MGDFRAIDTSGYLAIDARGEPGPAPRLQWLPIAALVVDDAYQRSLASEHRRGGPGNTSAGRKNVRRIAESFAWSKFSPVIVAAVDGGKFAIIDGQHRTTAAALRGIESVPCQIIVADRAQQAAAFASINGNVTRMTALHLHHAAVAAGEPEAVAIHAAVTAAGVRILRSPTPHEHLKPGDTMAIAETVASFRAYGAPALVAGLKCVTATRHNQPAMLRLGVIRGLTSVAAEFDHDALIAAVGQLPLPEGIRRADAMRIGGVRSWAALGDWLRGRLRTIALRPATPATRPAPAAANGNAEPPGAPKRAPLSARDMEKALEERPVVSTKRAAGVPWSHIARQLNVGELDLRRRHDPDFVA